MSLASDTRYTGSRWHGCNGQSRHGEKCNSELRNFAILFFQFTIDFLSNSYNMRIASFYTHLGEADGPFIQKPRSQLERDRGEEG